MNSAGFIYIEIFSFEKYIDEASRILVSCTLCSFRAKKRTIRAPRLDSSGQPSVFNIPIANNKHPNDAITGPNAPVPLLEPNDRLVRNCETDLRTQKTSHSREFITRLFIHFFTLPYTHAHMNTLRITAEVCLFMFICLFISTKCTL